MWVPKIDPGTALPGAGGGATGGEDWEGFQGVLITFWAVRAGSSGMGFDGEGVLQQPLRGGDLLTLLPEIFKVEFDGLSCHRYRLLDGLPEGDTAG